MNEGTTRIDEAAELMKGPQGTAFRKFYGKAFLEDHLGNIRWKGSMKTALASKLARNPRWKGWIFQRTETREKDGIKTTLFIYDEMPNHRAKREKAEREPEEIKVAKAHQERQEEADRTAAEAGLTQELEAQDDQAKAEAQALGEQQAKDEAQAEQEAEARDEGHEDEEHERIDNEGMI